MTSLDNITLVLMPPLVAPFAPPYPWWLNSEYPRAKRRRAATIGDTVWTVVVPDHAATNKMPYNAIALQMGIIAG